MPGMGIPRPACCSAAYQGGEYKKMAIATSIVVFAIGAILRFATTVHTSNWNIHTIGVILMIVGAVGFVVSLIFWGTWGGFGGSGRRRRTTYREADGTIVQEDRTSGF
jgi:preprotein translocase subunit Sss1